MLIPFSANQFIITNETDVTAQMLSISVCIETVALRLSCFDMLSMFGEELTENNSLLNVSYGSL